MALVFEEKSSVCFCKVASICHSTSAVSIPQFSSIFTVRFTEPLAFFSGFMIIVMSSTTGCNFSRVTVVVPSKLCFVFASSQYPFAVRVHVPDVSFISKVRSELFTTALYFSVEFVFTASTV